MPLLSDLRGRAFRIKRDALASGTLPEPMSLALVRAGLFAAAAFRRKTL